MTQESQLQTDTQCVRVTC